MYPSLHPTNWNIASIYTTLLNCCHVDHNLYSARSVDTPFNFPFVWSFCDIWKFWLVSLFWHSILGYRLLSLLPCCPLFGQFVGGHPFPQLPLRFCLMVPLMCVSLSLISSKLDDIIPFHGPSGHWYVDIHIFGRAPNILIQPYKKPFFFLTLVML